MEKTTYEALKFLADSWGLKTENHDNDVFKSYIKLTGNDLATVVRNLRESGYKHADIATHCGYKQENGKIAWTEFYSELLKVKEYDARLEVMRNSDNNYPSKTVENIIDALRYFKPYSYRYDCVKRDEYGRMAFYHYGEKLVVFGSQSIQLFMPSQKSKSTKERLNRILMHFAGVNLFQKQGVWYIVTPYYGDQEYINGMKVEYPIHLLG